MGPEPSNAAATPNYRMIVEIDNISVYVTRSGGNTSTAVHWAETTPDHAATSTAMSNLPVVSSPYANPAFYTQLSWDPADYEVALGSYNESFQRMFNFVRTGTGDIFGDGIEISGRVHLIYDAVEIPEPNGLALAGLAALGLGAVLVRRRQSKKL